MTERCKFEVSTGFAKFNYEVSTEIYRVLIIGVVECMLSERSVLYDSSSSTRKNRFYFLQKKFTVHGIRHILDVGGALLHRPFFHRGST